MSLWFAGYPKTEIGKIRPETARRNLRRRTSGLGRVATARVWRISESLCPIYSSCAATQASGRPRCSRGTATGLTPATADRTWRRLSRRLPKLRASIRHWARSPLFKATCSGAPPLPSATLPALSSHACRRSRKPCRLGRSGPMRSSMTASASSAGVTAIGSGYSPGAARTGPTECRSLPRP
jgi:hypothetical protein